MKISRFVTLFVMTLALIILASSTAQALTKTNLYVTTSPKDVYFKKQVIVAGVLWSGSASYSQEKGINGKSVAIQYRRKGTSKWLLYKNVSTVYTRLGYRPYNGFYAYIHKPTKNTQYRAVFNGDETYASSKSSATTVFVRAKVRLLRKLDRKRKILRLSGKVFPRHRAKIVVIKIRRKGKKRWTRLAKLKTNRKSAFRYRWKYGKKRGTYFIKAVFAGDKDHAKGKSKEIKLVLR